MNDSELIQAARLVDAYALPDVRWGELRASPGDAYRARLGTGTMKLSDGRIERFIVRRLSDAKGRTFGSICQDYREALTSSQESAGYGSGLGGFPHWLACAETMLILGPEEDKPAWLAVIKRFERADAHRRARES